VALVKIDDAGLGGGNETHPLRQFIKVDLLSVFW
jgi:hypothetical protein